ncbi:MAG: hypothetical protein ACLFM3_08745, partial [Desulfohalobiaceae bacterium]
SFSVEEISLELTTLVHCCGFGVLCLQVAYSLDWPRNCSAEQTLVLPGIKREIISINKLYLFCLSTAVQDASAKTIFLHWLEVSKNKGLGFHI